MLLAKLCNLQHDSQDCRGAVPCHVSDWQDNLLRTKLKDNRERLAKPGVIEERSHSIWPSRGLSSMIPDQNLLTV